MNMKGDVIYSYTHVHVVVVYIQQYDNMCCLMVTNETLKHDEDW